MPDDTNLIKAHEGPMVIKITLGQLVGNKGGTVNGTEPEVRSFYFAAGGGGTASLNFTIRSAETF